LFKPYLEGDENRRQLLIYILQQHHLARLDLAREIGRKYFDQVAVRTIGMLSKACPHLSKRDLVWRYSFCITGVLAAVSDGANNRIKRLSDGAADASDRAQLTQQAIDFVVDVFERGLDRRSDAKQREH
jgi:hypothetical protein